MAADTGIADDGTTVLNLPSVAQQSTIAPTDQGDGAFTWDEILRHLVGFQRSHKLAHATGGRDALVASDIGASQALTPTAVKTANYTAAAGDLVPVDTTSGPVTVTLPTAPADKTRVAVKLVILGGSNAVTIARGGADVFNRTGGSTSLSLSLVNQSVNLQYKASSAIWYVVADDLPLGDLDARFVAGTLDTDGTLAANSDTHVASQKAVKTYADALIAANDAMVFKGVIDCSSNPNYPAADRGHTYRVSVAGKIGGASGTNVEVGDLLLCLTDGTAAGTQAAVGAQWEIAQANIDGAVTGPASSTDAHFATFSGAGGKVIQDSGLALDTDGALAANSDARLVSQKAVKTYADAVAAASVPKSLFDAETILAATTDNTPAALTVPASTVVGRIATGDIIAMTMAQLKTLLALVPSDIPGAFGIVRTLRDPIESAAVTCGSGVTRYYRVVEGGTISKVRVFVQTSSGNVCVAAYQNSGSGLSSVPGTRLASSGSVACPGGAAASDVSLGASVTLAVGDWLAISCDNGTATFAGITGFGTGSLDAGMAMQETVFPAPTTPSPTAANNRVIALVGVP